MEARAGWFAYVDEESRCHAETAVDAVEHGPAELAAMYTLLRGEATGIETATVVYAPDEDAKASHWAAD